MMASLTMWAEGMDTWNGTSWNCSNLAYTATENADKTITFSAMAEGEELAFRLTPNYSKRGEYTLSNEPTNDFLNPFSESPRVKHMKQEGYNLLCLYDQKGLLRNVLEKMGLADAEKIAQSKWNTQLAGNYKSRHGEPLSIDYETMKTV